MKKKPQLEVKKSKRTLQCKFAPAELLQLGKDLAERTKLYSQTEAEKKQVTKQFDAKLAEIEAQIQQLSNNLQSGYEYRSVDCTETVGEPEENRKTVRRLDTNEVVEVRELTNDEKQRKLEFEKEQEKPAATEAKA